MPQILKVTVRKKCLKESQKKKEFVISFLVQAVNLIDFTALFATILLLNREILVKFQSCAATVMILSKSEYLIKINV